MCYFVSKLLPGERRAEGEERERERESVELAACSSVTAARAASICPCPTGDGECWKEGLIARCLGQQQSSRAKRAPLFQRGLSSYRREPLLDSMVEERGCGHPPLSIGLGILWRGLL
jgi:hypothetical protein